MSFSSCLHLSIEPTVSPSPSKCNPNHLLLHSGTGLEKTFSPARQGVCLLVHPWPGITRLQGRLCSQPPVVDPLLLSSLSLPLSCICSLCIFPPFHLSHSPSECLGPRPQKQRVAFCYRPARAALIAFATAGNWECVCVQAVIVNHCSDPASSTAPSFKTPACRSDHRVTFQLGCLREVNKRQTQDLQDYFAFPQ